MTYQESVWDKSPSLKSYTLANFRDIPQIEKLPEEKKFEMEVVGNVLPFKANNYKTHLIKKKLQKLQIKFVYN